MAIDGEPVPGTFAAEDELFGIGRVLGELGRGRLRARPGGRARRGPRRARPRDGVDAQALRRDRPAGDVRAHPERPRSRGVAAHARPVRGRRVAEGASVRPQVAGRPVTLLLGLQTFHPFAYCPSWAAVVGLRRRPRRPRACAIPRSGAGCSPKSTPRSSRCRSSSIPSAAFPIGAFPNYEPGRDTSIAARARAENRAPMEVFYDVLMEDDGRRARHAAAAQLHRLLPRRGARDARAPDERVGPRRRRRALRHDVRREHAHVHAHALDARP